MIFYSEEDLDDFFPTTLKNSKKCFNHVSLSCFCVLFIFQIIFIGCP